MFATAVPVTSAGLLSEWVDQQRALERLPGHDQTLDSLEVATRLLLIVRRRSQRQRLEIAVAAASGMTDHAPGVARAPAQKDGLHLVSIDLVVQRQNRARR